MTLTLAWFSDLNVYRMPSMHYRSLQADIFSRMLEYWSYAERSKVADKGYSPSNFFLKLIMSLIIELIDGVRVLVG